MDPTTSTSTYPSQITLLKSRAFSSYLYAKGVQKQIVEHYLHHLTTKSRSFQTLSLAELNDETMAKLMLETWSDFRAELRNHFTDLRDRLGEQSLGEFGRWAIEKPPEGNWIELVEGDPNGDGDLVVEFH